MGVYIKGMKMPKCCDLCKLALYRKCVLWNGFREGFENRHPDCPLIEVTEPHGRLIDESQIKTVYGEAMTTRYQGYISRTEKITHTDAPTVIEAEGE